jgi:hypothetical protein
MTTQNAQQGNVVVGQDGTSRIVQELKTTIGDDNSVLWRYSVAAFFLQTQSMGYPATADFTAAGKPSAWGSAYLGEESGSGNTGDNTPTSHTPAPQYLKRVVYGNSCRIEGWGDLSKLTVAIYSYDRYGVEHEAALFEGEGVYDYPQVIFWELNGGTVDVELPKLADIRLVEENDKCVDCGADLKVTRGIEVGNIFKLGTKYSKALNLQYLDQNQKLQDVYMGSYGIGIGRCLASIVEQNHDDKGIIFPKDIAPFKVGVITINIKDQLQMKFQKDYISFVSVQSFQ